MPLEWSEQQEPNGCVSVYTHCVARTPIGTIILEWKGWKDGDGPCATMPWNEFVMGIDLEDAKQQVQAAWDRMIPALLPLCSDPLLSR